MTPDDATHDRHDEAADAGVMARDGYYDEHSTTQRGAAALGLDDIRAAVADLDDPVLAGPVAVVDMGCAQGHNSLAPVATALDALRLRTDGDLDVVHTDLPGNDWATLFEVIETDPASYLAQHERVHPSVVGRSFYDRLCGPGRMTLGWCSSALHWLSAAPGPVDDHFFVQSSTDAGAIDRYRTRAADDLSRFLAHRSVEVAPSGAVVFVDVLMGDDATMGSEGLFDCLEHALRRARDRGDLTAAEYAATVYPTWFRTVDELRAPFDPVFEGPEGGVLELESLEPTILVDPFLAALDASGDAAAYGRDQAGFLRGFLEPSFRAALPDRDDASATAILDAVFADAATAVAADPAAVSPRYRLVTGRIRRSL